MSELVLHIDEAETADSLAARLAGNPATRFVHVTHPGTGAEGINFIQVARKVPAARALLDVLANRGFLAYTLRGEVTSFVRVDRIRTLWNPVRSGQYSIDRNGIVYTLAEPAIKSSRPRMLVLFSSIAANMYSASLARHFEQNFSTIQKYIPADVMVLRIADLGGVIGAYYLDTNALPDNEKHIRDLIRRVAREQGVDEGDIVLYGGSKGGTAALLYGTTNRFKAVCVDPVLADKHYLEVYKDLHFTHGIFPETKEEKFERILSGMDYSLLRDVVVVTSRRSPQYPYIISALRHDVSSRIVLFESLHPEIKTHPDVSRKTINVAVMCINMLFYDIPPRPRSLRLL